VVSPSIRPGSRPASSLGKLADAARIDDLIAPAPRCHHGGPPISCGPDSEGRGQQVAAEWGLHRGIDGQPLAGQYVAPQARRSQDQHLAGGGPAPTGNEDAVHVGFDSSPGRPGRTLGGERVRVTGQGDVCGQLDPLAGQLRQRRVASDGQPGRQGCEYQHDAERGQRDYRSERPSTPVEHESQQPDRPGDTSRQRERSGNPGCDRTDRQPQIVHGWTISLVEQTLVGGSHPSTLGSDDAG
jgi:hypothetical protein